MDENGLIHVYYGEGKGKTTAGIGQCIRCAGAGKTVLIYQFLKGSGSGERMILKQIPNIFMFRGLESTKFTFQMESDEMDACLQFNRSLLERLVKIAGNYDLLFLDEALHLMEQDVDFNVYMMDFLKHKPPKLEVVLTGQKPSNALLEVADYVTEMKKIKHPYDRGITARMGIEK